MDNLTAVAEIQNLRERECFDGDNFTTGTFIYIYILKFLIMKLFIQIKLTGNELIIALLQKYIELKLQEEIHIHLAKQGHIYSWNY